MKVAIMQPTWLPWIGYFDLMDQVDTFVFLDDVQFQKQTWQQRNRLRSQNGLEWITVPVFISGKFGQFINEVKIRRDKFPTKQLKQIRQNYSKARYFDKYFSELESLLVNPQSDSLCDVNISLIEWVCEKLCIEKTFVRSSLLGASGKRGELVVDILRKVGADEYVSPIGALEYLREDIGYFNEAKINVQFHNYDHPVYEQLFRPFAAGACVLDLLFNEGEESIAVLRQGRRQSQPIEEFI